MPLVRIYMCIAVGTRFAQRQNVSECKTLKQDNQIQKVFVLCKIRRDSDIIDTMLDFDVSIANGKCVFGGFV